MSKKYINVVAYEKISLKFETFTYYVDSEYIDIGDLVEVPFGKKSIFGIVLEYIDKPNSDFEIKKVDTLIHKGVLLPGQIDMLKWMVDYFAVTPYKALKLFLPEYIYKRVKDPIKLDRFISKYLTKNKESEEIFNSDRYQYVPLNEEQNNIVDKVIHSIKDMHLLYGVTGSGKTHVYLNIIRNIVDSGGKVMLVVPEISITPQVIDRYEQYFQDKYEIFHSGLTDVQKSKVWLKAKDGDVDVLITTRSGLFLPMKDLSFIVVDEYHDWSFESEQKPAYNVRQIAMYLNKKQYIGVLYSTATPNIVDIESNIEKHTLNKSFSGKNVEIDTIDMKLNTSSKYISKKALEAIKNEITARGQVLIYHNQRGYSKVVTCNDCGYIYKCDKCDVSLSHHKIKDHNSSIKEYLMCHQCGTTTRFLHECPECGSYKFDNIRYGTQKTEDFMRGIFPDQKIIRVDRDAVDSRDFFEQFYKDMKNKEYDIIIGTNIVTKGFDFSHLHLVVVVDSDFGFNYPFFDAVERTMQTLFQVSGRVGRSDKAGKVLIQTYNPKNKYIQYLMKQDYNAFIKDELENRKIYNYPPECILINFLYTDISKEKCINYLENIKVIIDKIPEVITCAIVPGFIPKVSNKYHWQLVIKTKKYTQQMMDIFAKFKSGKVVVWE